MSGITANLVGWRNRRGRFASFEKELASAMGTVAHDVMEAAKKDAIAESPTGSTEGKPDGYVHFKDQWKTQVHLSRSGGQGSLYNVSDHARLVMLPTPEHDISIKSKLALRFEINGTVMFRRSVHHPGTKGNDIIGRIRPKFEAEGKAQLSKTTAKVQVGFSRIFG